MRGNFQPIELPKHLKSETRDMKLRVSKSVLQQLLKHLKSVMHELRISTSRTAATPEERDTRCEAERLRQSLSKRKIDGKNVAFNYDKDYDFRRYHDVVISSMINLCFYCHSLKFQKEHLVCVASMAKSICHHWRATRTPLLIYVAGATREFKHFLEHIRKYNSYFQMTSFEAMNIVRFHTHIQSSRTNVSSYWFIGSSTRRRSPVFENLFHGQC
ncbi:hypothetical protein NPIL_534861 [Nephila pilipes]|uniref:Uncharacterized protein n=1 Tax=Nephila pilipes TaxID=299642 RepID=A0A8X6PN33_NEPPI|nr:hypothetical protein NPIL_534861 [Nephila pilipes]